MRWTILTGYVISTCTECSLADTLQNEWDKYFPIEQNTGILNLPDFNYQDFNTPSFPGSAAQTYTQDLSDLNFPPTFIPDPRFTNPMQNHY